MYFKLVFIPDPVCAGCGPLNSFRRVSVCVSAARPALAIVSLQRHREHTDVFHRVWTCVKVCLSLRPLIVRQRVSLLKLSVRSLEQRPPC